MSGILRKEDFEPWRLRAIILLFGDGYNKSGDNIRRAAQVPSAQNMKTIRSALRMGGYGELLTVSQNNYRFIPYDGTPTSGEASYTTEDVDELLPKTLAEAKKIGARSVSVITIHL